MLSITSDMSRTTQNAMPPPEEDPDDLVAELTNLLLQQPTKQADDPADHAWSAWDHFFGPSAESWGDSQTEETAKNEGLTNDGNVEMSMERQKYKKLIDLFPDIPSASLAKALLKAEGDIAVAAQLLIGGESSPSECSSPNSKSWEENEDSDAFLRTHDFIPVHAKRARARGGAKIGGAKRKPELPQGVAKWTPGRNSESREPSRAASSMNPDNLQEVAPLNSLEEETEEAVRFLVDIIDNPDIGSDTIRDILGQYDDDVLQALACLEMLVAPPPARAGESGGSVEEDLGLQHLLQAFPDHDPAAVVMAYQTSNLDVSASASQLIISEEESGREAPSPPSAEFQASMREGRSLLFLHSPSSLPPTSPAGQLTGLGLFLSLDWSTCPLQSPTRYEWRCRVIPVTRAPLLRPEWETERAPPLAPFRETRKVLLESGAGPPPSPPAVRYDNPAPPAWGGPQPFIPDGGGGSVRWGREGEVQPQGPHRRQGRQVSSYDSEYSAARKKSDEYRYQMKWHFNRATEAYKRGDKEYAACLSVKGKENRQRAQELDGEAAQKLAQSK